MEETDVTIATCHESLKDPASWALLASADGIGPRHFTHVLNYLSKHEVGWDAFWVKFEKHLRKIPLHESIVQNVKKLTIEYSCTTYLEWLEEQDVSVLPAFAQNYPPLLRHCDDLPPVLFCRGSLPVLQLPLAIVGTRHMTSYGALATRRLAAELATQGVQVVSGFMYGVDVLAQETALSSGGLTVGVLAFGFNQMYPKTHASLFREFLDRGAVFVTEHPPDRKPVIASFPRRNRLLAGMSYGVLVTEAAQQSGSHITARLAGEYGREVFAVPGPLTNPYSEGTKELVNQGAQLVTCAADIIRSIGEVAANMGYGSVAVADTTSNNPTLHCHAALPALQQQILQKLEEQPQNFTQIQTLCAQPPPVILEHLLILESQGYTRHVGEVWVLA